MMLGSAQTSKQKDTEELLIVFLLNSKRYAEAYLLLKDESQTEVSTLYNFALCHYSAQNYTGAIIYLDKAYQLINPLPPIRPDAADSFYTSIKTLQNNTDAYRQAITKRYVSLFADVVKDAVLRLKIDCWLNLGEWQKVVEAGNSLKHKMYKNVNDALEAANQNMQ